MEVTMAIFLKRCIRVKSVLQRLCNRTISRDRIRDPKVELKLTIDWLARSEIQNIVTTTDKPRKEAQQAA